MMTAPPKMVRLERMSDYRGVSLQRLHCTYNCGMHWAPSIPDAFEPENTARMLKHPHFRGIGSDGTCPYWRGSAVFECAPRYQGYVFNSDPLSQPILILYGCSVLLSCQLAGMSP